MGHKHLHELLREDQEPFQLKNYIADRRCQLKSTRTTTTGKTTGDRKKPKHLTHNFCIRRVCIFSFQDSPKSPFLDLRSPVVKSPCNRFGLLGSFLKRLKERSSRMKLRQIRLSSPPARSSRQKEVDLGVAGSVCSCNNSRVTSADWSEKSSEFETSCSSWSVHDSDGIGFGGKNDIFASIENSFCSSPSSPFRFSLQKSPSSGRRTPDFLSPATSLAHHLQEEKEEYEAEKSHEINVEEEEEKEQCSPASVLDPLFEDKDDEHDGEAMEEDDYNLECLQRAKHELLQKLRRFEKLVELDPIELEKHMSEQCDDDVEEDATNEVFLRKIFDYLRVKKIPSHMKRLVSDLVVEETKNKPEEHDVVVKRVCKRFELWKMVDSNTIDMMVELDFRGEKSEGWRRFDEKTIRETGMDIERGMFWGLMEELTQELVTVFEDSLVQLAT